MPWRGPEIAGEFPTLGDLVANFIEESAVIPDGDHVGEPFLLTNEQTRFLQWFYRIDPVTGRRFHYPRGGQLVRPQKWGKGPFSAAIIIAEGLGPVRPDGFDAGGEPVGRPWSTPLIQVTAVSEDQTDNVWRVLQPMIELGDFAAEIPDTGETRINLPNGGRIEPVTSAANSRLGQRVTFVLQDETHSWTVRNGGRKLADTQRRNVAGMGGRFLETTNAWDPTEQSVAQLTNAKPAGVHVDYPPSPPGSVRNKRDRRKVLRAVYGDAWWIDLDRIDDEIEALLEHDPSQAERFFLNRTDAGESTAFDVHKWRALARLDPVPDRELIVVGIDGARFDDALAIVATTVEGGHQFPLGIWERPATADDDYEHPIGKGDEVDGALEEAFDRYKVWRVYIDPQYIEGLADRWVGRHPKIVHAWEMHRPKQAAWATRRYRQAIEAGDVTHDGDPVMARHVGAARRYAVSVKDDKGRPMWVVRKESPSSPRKIDAAAAGLLSWECRGDAVAAGARPPAPTVVGRIR